MYAIEDYRHSGILSTIHFDISIKAPKSNGNYRYSGQRRIVFSPPRCAIFILFAQQEPLMSFRGSHGTDDGHNNQGFQGILIFAVLVCHFLCLRIMVLAPRRKDAKKKQKTSLLCASAPLPVVAQRRSRCCCGALPAQLHLFWFLV